MSARRNKELAAREARRYWQVHRTYDTLRAFTNSKYKYIHVPAQWEKGLVTGYTVDAKYHTRMKLLTWGGGTLT